MPEFGTIAHLIELSIQAERNAEMLYRILSKKFEHHPDVKKFWDIYAAEEEGHAHWLENLRRRTSEETLMKPVDVEMLRQAQANANIELDSMVASIKDLQDAFEIVNELEHGETNTVFEFLIAHFSDDEKTQLFLRSQLRDHIGRLLMDFPANYRQPTLRRGVRVLDI